MAIESEKRPDLFIFDRRVIFSEDEAPLKSLVLIEFKKPQRDDYTLDDNPVVRGGPGLRDSLAAWLRWILGSITPPVSPAPSR
jgi:hypothetical protein